MSFRDDVKLVLGRIDEVSEDADREKAKMRAEIGRLFDESGLSYSQAVAESGLSRATLQTYRALYRARK